MARFIYVVARDRRDLYQKLKEDFAGQHDVAVVLDRRIRDRRTITIEPTAEFRRADRRRQRELERELRGAGSFITATSDIFLVVV